MAASFIKYAEEANQYISELASRIGFTEERTLRIVKSVLHVIRDRIQISESFNLISQLPLFLKGLYTDQWKYKDQPDKFKTATEFAANVLEEAGKTYEFDYENEEQVFWAVQEVLNSLRKYLSEGEISHIYSNLPTDIKTRVLYYANRESQQEERTI
jgi:uncharacterized protein (DUF2267 family)